MAKNKAAQKLGRVGGVKRWAAVPKRVRREAMRALALKRHGNVAGETRGPLAPNAENGQSPRCL